MVPFWKSREEELIKWADFGSRDFHNDDVSVDWDTFRWAEQFLVSPFLLMVLLQEVIPSVQGSFPRGLFLVLVAWTSSCKSLVQKISSGCLLL